MAKTTTLYSNNARTTLGSNITSTAVSFTVASAAAFPTISTAGQSFYVTLFDSVNIEVVLVTSVSGSTFTVTRAQDGTTASAFAAANTVVSHRLIAANIRNFARIDDHMGSLSGLAALTSPSTMNGNSYVTGDVSAEGAFITAVANTTSNIWSFVGYPAQVYSGTVGAGASTTSIALATATTILPDQNSLAYIVQFTSGTQQGQARLIGSMTSSTIVPSVAFASAPGSTDTYVVYRAVGHNVTAQIHQQAQMLDPTYVTSTINYSIGDKRLNAGSFQMYDGTNWNNYVLNYVASSPATVGSYSVAPVNGGYAGFDFTGAFHSQSFLASSTTKSSGVYSAADATWDWRWDAGVLAVGEVPYGLVTGTPNMSLYALLASPSFSGVPTAPTASTGTGTSQLATCAFVKNNSPVFTGNATAGTKTDVNSGIIEQWFEYFAAGAGGGIITVPYPVAFLSTAARPFVSLFDANLGSLGASNFVSANPVTFSLTGCTINIGQNGGGTRDVTLSIFVRGT